MTDEGKPTVASLAVHLRQAVEDIAAVKEAAEMAIGITGAQGEAIVTLKREQVALAKLLNGLNREPGEAVKPNGLDNVLARLEAVERNGKQDWSPLIAEYGERSDRLATRVKELAELFTAWEDKTGVQPGGPFEDLAREVEELRKVVDTELQQGGQVNSSVEAIATLAKDFDLLQAAVARLEHGSPDMVGSPVHQALVDLVEDRIREAVRNRASFEQDLLARVRNLEDSGLPGGLSSTVTFESGRPAGVNDKVLRLMDEITSISKDREASGGGIRYMFRGIEDAQNAVGAAMRKVRVLLRPEVVSWEHDTTPVLAPPGRDGVVKTVLWSTSRLTMRYVFVDPADGSEFAIEMVGEGKDNSDKSASKAASMACKYALFQALMIPFEQVDESDGNHAVQENVVPHSSTPGAQVSRGEITPAQAVQEYSQPKVAQSKGGYNPAMDSSAMAGADTDDTLMRKAAQAAYYLRQATQQPAEVALPAIKKTLTRVVDLGIGDYTVDGVTLIALANTALQNANAALVARTGGGAQGVTRQGQQAGDGARAATDWPEASQQEPPNYEGSLQEYQDACQALASPNVPDQVAESALRIVADWERGQQEQAAEARDTAVLNPGGTASGDHDY